MSFASLVKVPSKDDAGSAEPLLREALGIRRRAMPTGNWRIAEAEGVLGECLVLLRRFEEAEGLLVGSYETFSGQFKPDDKRPREALGRVVKLYEAWERPERAAHYRAVSNAP